MAANLGKLTCLIIANTAYQHVNQLPGTHLDVATWTALVNQIGHAQRYQETEILPRSDLVGAEMEAAVVSLFTSPEPPEAVGSPLDGSQEAEQYDAAKRDTRLFIYSGHGGPSPNTSPIDPDVVTGMDAALCGIDTGVKEVTVSGQNYIVVDDISTVLLDDQIGVATSKAPPACFLLRYS